MGNGDSSVLEARRLKPDLHFDEHAIWLKPYPDTNLRSRHYRSG